MSRKKKLKLLTPGYSEVKYAGKKYGVARQDFNNGDSMKVYAKELGGTNFISFNYYITGTGELLKPCEMPPEKVIHFLDNYVAISMG